jgi:AMP nucleosidase
MTSVIQPWRGEDHTHDFEIIDDAVAYAREIEEHQKAAIASGYDNFRNTGFEHCDPMVRKGIFAHAGVPYMKIDATFFPRPRDPRLGSNFFADKGVYKGTFSQLDLIGPRLARTLKEAKSNHGLNSMAIEVGVDDTMPMPLQYAVNEYIDYGDAKNEHLPQLFKIFSTLDADNNIIDQIKPDDSAEPYPLTFFNANRLAFQKTQFERYTNTSAQFATNCWVLFNFPHLVDLFEKLGRDILRGNPPAWLDRPEEFVELIVPGNKRYTRASPDKAEQAAPAITRGDVQMPAFHLRRADDTGISCALIGIGPSNAKNFTDKLAILRPDLVLMGGICGGFGETKKGNLVLAHNYIREDYVLDDVMPVNIPTSPLYEVQEPIRRAVEKVYGVTSDERRNVMHEGTVLTVDDRESDTKERIAELIERGRVQAMDMESATVATNCLRHGISYGFLGIVSDRPHKGDVRFAASASKLQEDYYKNFLAALVCSAQNFEARKGDYPSRKLRKSTRYPALNC